jgi:alpha-L-rhamnosidase
VTYRNNTVLGEAGISWKNKADQFIMEVTVPVGSKATVVVPYGDLASLTESGSAIKQAKGVHFVSATKNSVVLEVESGNYQFQVKK